MTGFTKRSVDNYIRNNIRYWVYDLGRNAHLFLKKELGLSTDQLDDFTADDKKAVRDFQRMVSDNVIVTGGAFTSMLMGEEPNDLDLYFKTREVARLVARFYVARMLSVGNMVNNDYCPTTEIIDTDDGISVIVKSAGIAGDGVDLGKYQYFEAYPDAATDAFFSAYKKKTKKIDHELPENRYQVAFLTSNAISLHGGIQMIMRFCGDVESIHSNFDFIHATNYWTWEEGVVYNVEALAATHEKRLYYFGSKFPVASIFRLRKFIERGWRISAGEMLKIAYDVSKLDLDDVDTLRDQSMGMDSAYFRQVIELLQDRSNELQASGETTSPTKSVDRTYLFAVINEAFNMADKQDQWLDEKSKAEEQPTVDLTDLN